MRTLTSGLTLAFALFIAACGGGGGGGGNSSGGNTNQRPTANAGAAQTVASGAVVTLNGSGTDSDGSIASYAWTQTAGAAVTLSSTTVTSPTFTAPTVGAATVFTFSLVVTDNRGLVSTASTVNITVNAPVGNQPPVANAGTAQSVTSGVVVTLNGSASNDPDGTITSYAWTQTAGAAVTLSSTSVAQPIFTAPAVGGATTLTFSLIVTDNLGATSAASTVNITVNPAPNTPPTANPGPVQSVPAGSLVALNGGGSGDPDGTIVSFLWTQTSGTAVTISNPTNSIATFTAPTIASSTVLTFNLVVTDDDGASNSASVNVTVNPVGTPNVTISGTIRYSRPPFNTSSPFGLNYAGATFQPARGVLVRAVYSGTETVISTTSADANGEYSLQVPGNTSVQIRPIAWLLRDGLGQLPRYDVRVADHGGGFPYGYSGAAFDSASGTTSNVDIPLNINAAGSATGTRHSGPFAALDTIYEAMQLVLSVAPTAIFPPLVVDWGSQTEGTFFDSGNPQRIALLSDLTEDTDEFDQHVVAHEFGHYVEHNFSRSDSIGGPHGVGDRLDIRLAFGEGFGYAFAAIVLNDPQARDSFVDGSTQRSFGFNIEDNPPATNDPTGCWCSESSVWAILYDLYDNAADAGDTLALGFGPLWNVLTGDQRTTTAFTSIFSFISALKTARPADAAAIDALLAPQNIDSIADAFGTGETHTSTVGMPAVPAAAQLPLYTSITVGGGSVVLSSSDNAGTYNKLGNHRFLRFTPASSTVTITVRTSNSNTGADPDFVVWRAGAFVDSGESSVFQVETATINVVAGTTYLLDVYDCANGCGAPQGTAGEYNLTVTIN